MNFLSLVAQSVQKSSQYELKEAATQNYPFQINGKTFFTKQSCHSNTLLNGIKLEFEQAKGINQNIDQIAYLYLSQEVAFCSGSNIVSYSPQRKQFNCIVQASNVEIIRSFYDKNQNKQYLLWLQKHKNQRIYYVFDCQTKSTIFCQNIPNDVQVTELIMTEQGSAKIIGFMTITPNFNSEVHYKVVYQQQSRQGKTDIGFQILFLSQEIYNIKYSQQLCGFLYSNNQVIISLKFKVDTILRQIKIQKQKLLQSKTGKIIDFETNQLHVILVTEQQIEFFMIKPFNFSHNYKIKSIFQDTQKHKHLNAKQIRANQSSLILIHEDDSMVSAFSIPGSSVQLVSTNALKLESMTQVIKIYLNPFNSQVTTLTRHYESQPQRSQTNQFQSKIRRKNSSLRGSQKKYHYEITTSYMALNSLKAGSNKLCLKPQKYLNILTASWDPNFLIQTDREIISEKWSDIFENVKCAAIHPYSLYMLVGFKDSFKIYSVTNEGIINTYRGDSVKDCHALAYSAYGNHFAVGTSVSIIIYGSYDCKKQRTIPLTINLVVEDLRYSHGQLICTMKSKRKFIYCAQNDYKQLFSFNPKIHSTEIKNESQVNSIFYDYNLRVVIFSALNKLYFINIEDYSILGIHQFQNVTCIQYCELLETLFLGTQTGSIFAFSWPNKPVNITQQMPVFKFHEGKVLKIKVSSNLRQLMSIGSDGSLYRCRINIIQNMKRIKLKQWLDIKKVNQQKLVSHILSDMKLCQYTYSQWSKKTQDLKCLQDQATSCNFMYPEQRQKQKSSIVKQIQTKKSQMKKQNEDAYGTLNKNDLEIKAMSSKIQHQIQMLQPMHRRNVDDQKRNFEYTLSKILKQREELRITYDEKFKEYNLETKKVKKEYHQQMEKLENIQNQFFRTKQGMISRFSNRKQETSYDNYLLKQIEQESEVIKNDRLRQVQGIKQQLSSRNGFLLCRINETKKEMVNTKRKMQEMKYLIYNTEKANKKLAQQQPKQTEDNSVRISQAQKNSMKAMKGLIQKGKQIDVNIKMFQRQQKVVIVLQKTLQRTQKQIQKIVQDVEKEKNQRITRQQKYRKITKKLLSLQSQNNRVQKNKIQARNKLKAFTTTIYLYLEKSIKFQEMVKKLALKNFQEPATHKSFDLKRSQDIVLKKIKQQGRACNYILNEKKYFASTFRKMNIQNQDLVKSLNQLRFQNKSIINTMRNQENTMSDIIKSSVRLSTKQSQIQKLTPFQKYIKTKGKMLAGRRVQTLPSGQQF